MITGSSDRSYMSDINVTPFVDVMLVLLIIFMVTAPMMMEGIDVALPEATAKPMESEKEHLIVSIDADGKVFINDIRVTVDDLNKKMTAILAGGLDRTIYLKADKDIPYGTVVQVMSEIKGAGIEKLGMITIPLENQSGT